MVEIPYFVRSKKNNNPIINVNLCNSIAIDRCEVREHRNCAPFDSVIYKIMFNGGEMEWKYDKVEDRDNDFNALLNYIDVDAIGADKE